MSGLPRGASRWADDDDDEPEGVRETPVDNKGFKTRTQVTTNAAGQKVRITSKIKVTKTTVRLPRRVIERQSMPRFGLATNTQDDSNITIRAHDVIPMEHPEDQFKDDDQDPLALVRASRMSQLDRDLNLDDTGPPGRSSGGLYRPPGASAAADEDPSGASGDARLGGSGGAGGGGGG
eukprot:CAMPEP_0198428704 /NCGR_PEP_ID=MMETSP1452-20131203/6731_1 /TAXON_ID=1181717 /ORGANISM="Synchroma pusillum, Strain CCMP3072" /LENGTH=177 /DNA_ID=CAMNT_0044149101 /DNA_START=91 /DNA_END=621 /DNA_ORIENTATION=-